MSTETESARACLGHLCLMPRPENPEQAGWRDGYCPDCQDELARDEIRAERQDARNEVERSTPPAERPTLACPKCGERTNMVLHEDGEWTCHSTHPVERPTPITDALASSVQESFGDSAFVDAVCVDVLLGAHRDLERQLAEANKARDDYFSAWTTCLRKRGELKEQLAEARDTIEHLRMENGLIEFYQLKDQRDRLADALRSLVSECEYQAKFGQFNGDRIEMDQARSELATLDRKEAE